MKILHVAAHLGKGVGAVVLPYLEQAATLHDQTVVCFGYTREYEESYVASIRVPLLADMASDWDTVKLLIAEADVVFVHWWNHPLLLDFFVRSKLPPCRLIFWAHASGVFPPNNFTSRSLAYPDRFIFTTPLSRDVYEVVKFKKKEKFGVVWSTGGCERLKGITLKPHAGFNVGYIGTTDYTKMHPDYVEMSDAVQVPAKFIVIGGPIKHAASDRFKFCGFVSEREKFDYLSTFDVFGYPLAPHHYGTCDQALQESMAIGVVPVVMANPMETVMVEDGETGLVVEKSKDYSKAIEHLYHNNKLRERLSGNAKQFAENTYSLEAMAIAWDNIFDAVIKLPKSAKQWLTKSALSPKDVFLESLGRYGVPFARNDEAAIWELAAGRNWQCDTKGTVHHYSTMFPVDKQLAHWSRFMRGFNASVAS